MSNIRISPEDMRGRADEYDQQAEAVGDVISAMDSLLETLMAEWEGEASKAYAEKFEELRPGFEKAQDLIGEIAKALRDTAQSMEDADQQIATGFRS